MNVIKNLSNYFLDNGTPKANSDEFTLQYYEIWISEGVMSPMRGNFKKLQKSMFLN